MKKNVKLNIELKFNKENIMAFNPLKSRNIEAPVEHPIATEQFSPTKETQSYNDYEYDDLVQHDSAPIIEKQNIPDIQQIQEVKQSLEYEGQNIADLENSGLQTINLLKVASQNIIDRPKFNIPLLESTPVNFVLQSLGAKKIKENLYEINGQEISTKENKWYNTTLKKGHVNAVSLVKHIIALEEKIDEKENQKTLFIAACKKLAKIQEDAVSNDMIYEQSSNQETTPKANEEVPKETQPKADFKYEPSEAVKKAQAQSGKTNNKIDWKALTDHLNNIPLDLVMEHLGANPNEDGQRGKWKIWKTGHNVHVTGQKWNDWNAQVGGIGGISLLAYHICIENNWNYKIDEDRKEARKLATKDLMNTFGSDFNINDLGGSLEVTKDFKEPFYMPHVIDFKIDQVRKYLNEQRGLPIWIINKQIQSSSLFAGFPSNWRDEPNLKNPDKLSNDRVWATFLSSNGTAAEMRAIGNVESNAKILAKGSDKDLGGFLIKAEKDSEGKTERTVVSCEAAIDTMSYHAFYPGRIVMSCMGVNFKLAVKSAVEALDSGFKYQLAFDNDLAGNEAAVRFRESLIDEIGEEEYQSYIKDNKINYFDLSIRCLIQTIKKGGVFYFDVMANDTGRSAVGMFQEQLYKVVPRETVKELTQKGKIKYANIAPSYGLMQDPEKEARDAVNTLLSSKPLYIVLKQPGEEEKPEIKEKREAFESAFQRVAGSNLQQFEKEGKVIYKKQALAKDWNEFFIIMKKDPKFKEKIEAQELTYSHYNEENNQTKKKGKHP